MNLLNGNKFELPNVFAKLHPLFGQPPRATPTENRNVLDAIAKPFVTFHNPAELSFPDHMKPVVPGAGGYVTMGLGPVVYDHQPQWDRGKDMAGPVRTFFRGLLFDNRVKHL